MSVGQDVTSVFYLKCTKIHLSNVLTDHFSNSLSEKTTNDIHMKFYSFISRRLFIGCRYQIVEFTKKTFILDEMLFSCFTALALRALVQSHFKLDILQDSEPPHKKIAK